MYGPSNKKHPHLRDAVESNTKDRHIGLSPHSSLFAFLHRQPIADIKQYNSTTPYNFTGVNRMVYNHWKSKILLKWSPFSNTILLKRKMASAPLAVSVEHHRLFVEDAILLKPDEPLVFLSSITHSFFADKWTTNTWNILYIKAWESKPLHLVQLQNMMYYAVSVSLEANPRASEYAMNHFVESEIQYHCTSTGGGGIIIRFSNNEQMLIRFNDLIEDTINMQLWKCWSMDR